MPTVAHTNDRPGSLELERPQSIMMNIRRQRRGCEKIVASEERSRCILGAPSRATPWPWLSAEAQDRFAGSEAERKPRRGESQGWDEQPECMLNT